MFPNQGDFSGKEGSGWRLAKPPSGSRAELRAGNQQPLAQKGGRGGGRGCCRQVSRWAGCVEKEKGNRKDGTDVIGGLEGKFRLWSCWLSCPTQPGP